MRLIPAIDLRDGQVVRLTQGDDGRRTRYGVDPFEVVREYAGAGVDLIHVVDLDGALGEMPQRELLSALIAAARDVGARIELGGGLGDQDAVAWAIEAGCERVVLGSMLARDFERFSSIVHAFPNRVVPAIEVAGGKLRISGWTKEAALSVDDACRRLRGLPCSAVLVTDVERDGTMVGPNLELARQVAIDTGIASLLSGGVRSLEDLTAASQVPEIAGAIVGKAIYEGVFSVSEAMRACRPERGPEVRTGLTHRIIPCLDVRDGRVVKGVKFKNLRDQGDPAESAERYAAQGADEIVFLDITASPEGRDADRDWIRRTAERVFIPLSVGGGVRCVEDAEKLLRSGADKVGVNTAAIANPDLIDDLAQRFGSQCVVLSVDALGDGAAGWEVVTHGGRQRQGRDAIEWILEGIDRGAGEILLTSIDSDGTRDGYDLELLRQVCPRMEVPVIASGGAGRPEHLADALRAGAAAVLAASIFHQGTYTVGEIKAFLANEGFPIREEKLGVEELGANSLSGSGSTS